jgi:hypothetical protein
VSAGDADTDIDEGDQGDTNHKNGDQPIASRCWLRVRLLAEAVRAHFPPRGDVRPDRIGRGRGVELCFVGLVCWLGTLCLARCLHPHLYIWKDRALSIPPLCFLSSLHTLLSLPRTGSRRRR